MYLLRWIASFRKLLVAFQPFSDKSRTDTGHNRSPKRMASIGGKFHPVQAVGTCTVGDWIVYSWLSIMCPYGLTNRRTTLRSLVVFRWMRKPAVLVYTADTCRLVFWN